MWIRIGLVVVVAVFVVSLFSSGVVLSSGQTDGLFSYYSRSDQEIVLFDRSGTELYSWFDEGDSDKGQVAHIFADGSVLFITHLESLRFISNTSETLWMIDDARIHHDLLVLDNTILTLSRYPRNISVENTSVELWDDRLSVVQGGVIVNELSFVDVFGLDVMYDSYLRNRGDEPITNVLHVNKIEILERDYSDVFTRGRILFSARNMNTIGLLDFESQEVVWSYSGELDMQHSPVMRENGNILIFNNNRNSDKQSEVIEIDPSTNEVVDRYSGPKLKPLGSEYMGAVQVLPSGNVLITDSLNGRALEVDWESKDVVWEFRTQRTLWDLKRDHLYELTYIE